MSGLRGDPMEFGMKQLITDDMVTDARLNVVDATMFQMRREFDRMKTERGWPKDAAPLWEIRWHYTESGD